MRWNHFASSLTRLAMLLIAATLFTGCGSKLEGTYTPQGDGFGAILESITLKSGGKVEATGLGMTKEGTWEVEGKKVKITISGDTTVFTLDDNGCLDGGQLIGKFCKGAKAAASASGSSSDAKKSSVAKAGTPSGVYECKGPDGSVYAMEFLSGGKLKMTATEGGHSDTTEGTWRASGDDEVTVMSEEGPMKLTRKGNSLEASMGGMTMTFTKK